MKKILALGLSVVLILSMVSCKEEEPPVQPPEEPKTTSIYQNVYDVERAETGLTWPEGQSMPSFAYAAGEVETINVDKESNNEQYLLVSLQGIVNRTQPRIALCHGDEKSGDATWLKEEGITLKYVKDYNDLILKYKDEIKGLVIWDTKRADTINLAHTYAGIYDALAVTAKQAETYSQEPYNFPILEDYTGDFKNKIEVYEYMYENLWEHCTHN